MVAFIVLVLVSSVLAKQKSFYEMTYLCWLRCKILISQSIKILFPGLILSSYTSKLLK